MGKRLLASFLAAAMMLTMAPFAFAIENTEDTIDDDQIPAAEEAVDEENQIETQSESALQQAINNAADGSTVMMSEDEKADITINKSITLNLNNKTLTNTNAGKATITVTDGATVTVKNGTVMGGTSYYNIQVGTAVNSTANLTLEGVTATAGNTGSSMIDNWGTLTIGSGTYTGGLNVVKSEEGSTLNISGGEFTLNHAVSYKYNGVIWTYGTANITGGTFTQAATTPAKGQPCVVVTGFTEGYPSMTTITGGTFVNNHDGTNAKILHGYDKATSDNFEVSGGTFNKPVSSSYLKKGYAVSGSGSTYSLKTAVMNVTLNETSKTLRGGDTFQLIATPVETDAEIQTVSFSSKNRTVATVSKTGVVTAKQPGKVTIVVTPAGSHANTAECELTITEGNVTVTTKNKNVFHYLTLKDAFTAASTGETVTLLQDMTEDVVLNPSAKKNYILNLNGHTLTNAGGDTITIGAKANLTIKGEGTVDNVTHGKAAIYNNGTVTLNGGTYTRSLETGDKVTLKNTYYNILNHGIMTINNGVTVKQDGNYSSLVANGYYNYKDINAGERTAYIEGTGQANPKLIINGGNFSGGINTIKNDDGAELTIQDGTFRNATQYVVMNNNIAAINGGKFEGLNNDMEVVYTQYYAGGVNAGKLSITGGNFVGKITGNASANIKISNGVFSVQPDAKYLAPGYKAEQTNGVWVVKSGTNDAINALDAALAAIKTDPNITNKDTQDKIDAALDAIVDIPNEKLSDTTTLGKLAELDSAVKKDTSSKVTVEKDTQIKEVQNAALSADPAVPGDQIIKINAASADLTDAEKNEAITEAGAAENATVEALTITMSRTANGTTQNDLQPNAPVLLTFALPSGWENAQIVDIADDGTVTKVPTTVNTTEKTITGVFNHFSTKAIVQLAATANDNQYEFILEPSVTDVSAGDEITYTVKLKHISGDSRNVGGFIFAPTIENADLLELVESKCVAIGEDVKTSTNTGHFEFTYNKSAGVSVPIGATMDVGTLVYKVKAYGTDNASVAVVGNSSADQVTSVKLNGSAIPSVSTTKSVTYHVTKVTFQQDEKTSSEFFVPYNGSKLYLNLEDLAAGQNEQIAPTLSKDTTGGTAYRVLDEDWHLSTNTAELYNASTKFKTSVTYVPLTVNLVEIVLPTNPTVTVNATEGHPLTERDNRTFVDEGADLNFTVGKNDTNGEKYDVTVKVNDTKVDATLSTNDDGTITGKVDGDAITGKVTFEIKSVLDLTEDDIGIFTKGEDDTLAYREYSSYSGDDTLVLIKGKAGANYTLDAGEPTIYANTAYGDGYTHAVLVPKQNTVSKKAMLDYLVAQGLKTTTEANKAINSTSWDTNGNGNENRDLGDYQATNDFKTYKPSEDWGWTPTDDLLMLADVVTLNIDGDKYNADNYGVARDGWVSDTDVNAFVYLYAHLG